MKHKTQGKGLSYGGHHESKRTASGGFPTTEKDSSSGLRSLYHGVLNESRCVKDR